MKIAVIAANGRSGQAFVKAALAAGHEVRAGVTSGNTLPPPHPRLTIVTCDATKLDDLRTLVSGQEAVVSLIGHSKGSPATLQTDAIKNTVTAMQEQGIKRLVSLTGTGVRLAGDKIPLLDRILNLSISIIDPARVQDGKQHVKVLQQSSLDWTVIRVLKLQNVPSMPFTLQEHGPTKPYVGRTEVADAILQVLQRGTFIRQAPIVSKYTVQ